MGDDGHIVLRRLGPVGNETLVSLILADHQRLAEASDHILTNGVDQCLTRVKSCSDELCRRRTASLRQKFMKYLFKVAWAMARTSRRKENQIGRTALEMRK